MKEKRMNIVKGKTVRILVKGGRAPERDVRKKLREIFKMSKRETDVSIDVAIKEKEIRKEGKYLIRNGI